MLAADATSGYATSQDVDKDDLHRANTIAFPEAGMVDSTEPASRLPQGRFHTRDNPLPLRLPRDQEISNSVLDTISNKLFSRRRPIAPDSFEIFLRGLKEITLADIYHTLHEKSAASFDGLVWFAVSRQGLSAFYKRDLK